MPSSVLHAQAHMHAWQPKWQILVIRYIQSPSVNESHRPIPGTSMWKRELLAPNVPRLPDWVPRPPNGTNALKPDKDIVPVTATAKNGGWNGGTWMPEGIGSVSYTHLRAHET